MLSAATDKLHAMTDSAAIREHFGAAAEFSAVESRLADLASQISTWHDTPASISYRSPEHCAEDVEAANDKGQLHLCDRFFGKEAFNLDDKALTLIHEASHSLSGNEKFDVYEYTRLFKHLAHLDTAKALDNPDSLATFVELLVKGSQAASDRGKRDEQRGFAQVPQDAVAGAPSRGVEDVIHRAIAWADAKVDAAGIILDRLVQLRRALISGQPRLPYEKDISGMVAAFFDAARKLGIGKELNIVPQFSIKKMDGVDFDESELTPYQDEISKLKKIFSKSVTASVDDGAESSGVRWTGSS
jgi:hypothetical protein